jgi:uncharacterized membrane protein
MTLFCRNITAGKSKEVKARSNLAEYSKEGYGSKMAVLPMMMVFCVTADWEMQCNQPQAP